MLITITTKQRQQNKYSTNTIKMEVDEVAVYCILSKEFFLAMQFSQKKYQMARQSRLNIVFAASRKRIRQYKRFRSQRRKKFETCLKQSITLECIQPVDVERKYWCKTRSKNWWDSHLTCIILRHMFGLRYKN